METQAREIAVAPDHYEVSSEDVLLTAELRSGLAVCLHDAVEDGGALLHLRLTARAARSAELTDTTLATELLLLDRCVEALREIAPAARYLQARIVAHLDENTPGRGACESMLGIVAQFLVDAGASVGPPDLAIGAPRRLHFRPVMGRLQIR